MALGALIGAYQEDDAGGLRALLPLAGRTLIEYQARCVAAAGAAPIVVLVERIPAALNEAFDRLRQEGVQVIPVSDGMEAASRFELGELILLLGDGVAPPVELLDELARDPEPVIVTVPDDEAHDHFERVDASNRWSGIALVEGRTLGATAAMLGDWDLQSTLLRKTLQAGAAVVPLVDGAAEPLLAESADHLAGFERHLLLASRSARRDAASRFVLPILEDFATEQLMESRLRPQWLLSLALILCLAAAISFTRGWLAAAMALLVLSTPLDLVARRLAALRMKPLKPRALTRRLLWPSAGVALLTLGWWQAQEGGWGTFFAAATACAFAHAARIERGQLDVPGGIWLFSRRNAIFAALPFAIAGSWTALLVFLAVYAAASFFLVQHVQHRLRLN